MHRQLTLDLFLAHRQRLVRVAHGFVGDDAGAEDIVQDAWLRFDAASVGGLLEEPVGYLYRIVRNLAMDRCRRAALEARYLARGLIDLAEGVADDNPSAERRAIVRSDMDRIRQAIDRMPHRTRIAMEMHRFGGCKLREIAEHLGISVSRAHALVAEGIALCRVALDDDGADQPAQAID